MGIILWFIILIFLILVNSLYIPKNRVISVIFFVAAILAVSFVNRYNTGDWLKLRDFSSLGLGSLIIAGIITIVCLLASQVLSQYYEVRKKKRLPSSS